MPGTSIMRLTPPSTKASSYGCGLGRGGKPPQVPLLSMGVASAAALGAQVASGPADRTRRSPGDSRALAPRRRNAEQPIPPECCESSWAASLVVSAESRLILGSMPAFPLLHCPLGAVGGHPPRAESTRLPHRRFAEWPRHCCPYWQSGLVQVFGIRPWTTAERRDAA